MNFLKISISAIFPIFHKSSAAAVRTKIIVCILSNENMLDQTQNRLISPISNDIFFKAGVHFRF